MARTISTKLAVEGEAQYKQAITACNQQLATLKSQLALTESEFRGQANSMEALQAKGKALQAMYDKQADKIEKIRSALVNCEKAQGEYARRVEEAERNIREYEASLEKLKNTSGDTTEEQEKLQEGLAQWKKELAEATAGQEAAERGVQNWQKQLNYAGVELNDLSDRIQQNDQYMKEAAGSADGCTKSIDQYGDAVKDAGDATEDFGEESVSAVDALAQAMVAAGIADKAKEVAEALYDCVKTYGDFASQMSAVQAISGATGEEMEALSQKAQQMGQTTSFTAKEAGQALEYMAMAGWKTGDMLDGLDGIMNLAAASGEDLAMVSDIVTDGLTAFGMAAEESAHFADVLAAASANSNTNVAMLGESFSYAAPVAGALGYSLEDVSVALGLMANAGIKGSSAGTALRGTLTNLAKPTKQVDGYMQALGVSLTDSSGQIKPLSRLLGELREKFSGLTDAQKAQYAAGLAGKEAMSGLLAVVNASGADFEKLTQAINNCNGEAERMAQVRLDNFEGQVTLLNSALDGLKMTIGSQLAPLFEAVASGATSATNALSGLLEACPWLSSALLGLVSAAGAAALAIKGLAVANAVKAALGGLAAALAANPYAAAAVAIVGVGTALASLAAYFADATSAAGKMPAALGEINKAYEQSSTEINATAAAAENLVARLDVLGQQESLTAEEAAAYAQTVDQLKTLMPELNLEIDEHTGKLRDGTEAVREQIAALQEQALAQAMQEKYKAILDEQAQAMIDLAEKQADYKVALADMEAIYTQMQATAEELNRVERDSSLTYDEKQAKIAELQGRMMELSGAYTAAQDETNRLSDAVKESEGTVSQFDEALDKAQATAEQLPGALQESGGAVGDFGECIDSAVEKMISLESAYMETAEEALKSAESQFKLWDDLSGKVEESEVDVEKALESQEKYWTDLADNVTDLSSRGIEGMDGLVASLNDGSVEGTAAIESLSNKSDSELQQMVEQYNRTKDAQARWAGESANVITGYSNEMSKLSAQMATDVKKMDLNGEAVQAGKNTMQGYIDGVNANKGSLAAAMRRAASDAWEAFKRTIGIASPSKAFRESGHDTVDGYVLGVEDQADSLQREMEKTAKKAEVSFKDAIPAVADAERKLFAQASQSVTLEASARKTQNAPSITNYFDVRDMVVREEADIDKIARKLSTMLTREMRGRGLHQ